MPGDDRVSLCATSGRVTVEGAGCADKMYGRMMDLFADYSYACRLIEGCASHPGAATRRCGCCRTAAQQRADPDENDQSRGRACYCSNFQKGLCFQPLTSRI